MSSSYHITADQYDTGELTPERPRLTAARVKITAPDGSAAYVFVSVALARGRLTATLEQDQTDYTPGAGLRGWDLRQSRPIRLKLFPDPTKETPDDRR